MRQVPHIGDEVLRDRSGGYAFRLVLHASSIGLPIGFFVWLWYNHSRDVVGVVLQAMMKLGGS